MGAFDKARGRRAKDTGDSIEIERIIDLPMVYPPTKEEIEAFCAVEVQGQYFDEGFRLFGCQVGAVLAWDLYEGLFAPIGVGWGKTLITLMIANRAFREGLSERSMLIVPPQVYEQLIKTDIAWARKRVGLEVPFHLLGGKPRDTRRRLADSQKKGCYIMTYSLLQVTDGEALLSGDIQDPPPNKPAIRGINPDLIILDEAHNVKNIGAARTDRLLRYLHARQPRLCALSGTITSKSIKDYYHLIAMALRGNNPLPMDPALAMNWSYVLDPEKVGDKTNASERSKTGPLMPLVRWAKENFPEHKTPPGTAGFRDAYKLRLTHTPGVVATGDADIGVSLVIQNQPVPRHTEHPDFATLKKHMDVVENEWRTPSGDEIEYGFHKWRYNFELTSGFYYKLRWPEVEELVSKGLTADEAEVYLDQAIEHHEEKQEYHRKLRRWLQYSGRPRLDTPLLVGSNMAAHGARDVGNALFEQWRAMKDLEFEGMPERISEPVRVCDYKVQHACNWAQKILKSTRGKLGGIVWYHHHALGEWLYEYMLEQGLPVIWCPSESKRKGSNAKILDPTNADQIIIAAMGGHGTGKNLQFHQHQHFAQWPRKADLLEQVLGRLHRNGQAADELFPNANNTLPFDHQNLWACLIDALYIHQTTGARQKAIYATWDPLPNRYPEDFLRERGFADVAQLDPASRAKLEEKFGNLK